jgi:Holliday junction resolvase RusA-like endonuclease
VGRPDADNFYKGIPDAISGNVFKKSSVNPLTGKKTPACSAPPSPVGRVLRDDSQVSDVAVYKRHWPRPLVYVRVTALDPLDPGPYPFTEEQEHA